MRVDICVAIDVAALPNAPLVNIPGYQNHILIANAAPYSLKFTSPTAVNIKYFHVQIDSANVKSNLDAEKLTQGLWTLAGYLGDWQNLSPGPLGTHTPF